MNLEKADNHRERREHGENPRAYAGLIDHPMGDCKNWPKNQDSRRGRCG